MESFGKEVLLTERDRGAGDGEGESRTRARDLAKRCANLLADKKLQEIKIFDVGDSLQITEYFVIASGLNARHIQSAGDHVARELRKEGMPSPAVEGQKEGKWILIDFDHLVVHLFLTENRKYYDLELLWGDSPEIDWSLEERPARSSG